MNRILIAVGIFILVFTTSLWAFFPFGPFVESTVSKSAKNMGMKIKYDGADSGIFSTTLKDVQLNGREIGDFTLRHTPMTIFTRSMKVSVKGIYNAEAEISEDLMEFDVTTSGRALDFIKEPVSLNGNVRIQGKIDIKGDSSRIKAQADKMLLETPLGEMTFENVSADIESAKSRVTINSIKSDDRNELNMKGTIRLKRIHMPDSEVALNGSIKLAGQRKSLSINGKIDNLHPVLN
ncbi:hypothetical protein [Seleniivibrio woodruffii]|uniref:Uncharacterized protein n=1 Tax=Seleniivibrio woodruffii TaxID=1078050 RepID=A0A4R1KEH2_9BACT|nr:hypothetical protein [Seleniivibrio woodruffii]TCK62393.1 hypothetical protein C8D98_0919 [Seleniivibrio woodruffii]TVZ34489.1 hypothetical protein OF66_0074 [Seleniivibrio woodruffii]